MHEAGSHAQAFAFLARRCKLAVSAGEAASELMRPHKRVVWPKSFAAGAAHEAAYPRSSFVGTHEPTAVGATVHDLCMSVSTKHEVDSVLKQHGRRRSGRHSGGSSWASGAEARRARRRAPRRDVKAFLATKLVCQRECMQSLAALPLPPPTPLQDWNRRNVTHARPRRETRRPHRHSPDRHPVAPRTAFGDAGGA